MAKGFPVGDVRASLAGRRGGAVSRETRRTQALARFYRVWPLMPREAALMILDDRRRAYEAGWRAGRRKAVA